MKKIFILFIMLTAAPQLHADTLTNVDDLALQIERVKDATDKLVPYTRANGKAADAFRTKAATQIKDASSAVKNVQEAVIAYEKAASDDEKAEIKKTYDMQLIIARTELNNAQTQIEEFNKLPLK